MRTRRVIVGMPAWTLGGPCVFADRLVRGLATAGHDARVLLTETPTTMIPQWAEPAEQPPDVRFDHLPVAAGDSWRVRWEALIRYLEEAAPCTYVMAHDWRNNVVAARLSNQVQLIGLVQADSPLEFDQMMRLGPLWNAIVTVSDVLRFNAAFRAPHLAARMVTIRNAVPALDRPPFKRSDGPLLIAYCGELRSHQKRLGDVLAVAERLQALGVDFRLDLIGDGSERAALEQRARALQAVDRVRFRGRMTSSDALDALADYHAVLLTSEFEGLSLALLEAMSRACVPVVSDLPSQSLLIQDGRNGYAVPVGDVDAFADRLARLAANPARRARLASAAFTSIAAGDYRTEDMLRSYLELFDRLDTMSAQGLYRRRRGPMPPPPRRIAGIGILDVDVSREVDEVNERPLWPDPVREVVPRRSTAASPRDLGDHKVLVSLPTPLISGVDVFSATLVAGLLRRGLNAVLFADADALDAVADLGLPVEAPEVGPDAPWADRWRRLRRHLDAQGPAVWLPNYSFDAGLVPALGPDVRSVVVAHSDDPYYYELVSRIGRDADALVGVSQAVTEHVARLLPSQGPRLHHVPYGVAPPTINRVPRDVGPLRLIYCGRIVTHQKRANDVLDVARRLDALDVPYTLTVVGDGEERAAFQDAGRDLALAGRLRFIGALPHEEVWPVLAASDILLLPSAFEGLSIAMLEAMAVGTVPVVSRIRSGVPDVIGEDVNGLTAPVADTAAFAGHIAALHADRARLRRLSEAAQRTLRADAYAASTMVDRYVEVLAAATADPVVRSGRPAPPAALAAEFRRRRRAGLFARKAVRRALRTAGL